jgi:hypothetical protein
MTYKLPSYSDPERCPVTFNVQPKLAFMIVTGTSELTFSPKTTVGDFKISVILTDNKGLNSISSFNLIVEGIKPSFLPEPPIPDVIEVMAGVKNIYKLSINSTCIECFVEHNPPLPRFI